MDGQDTDQVELFVSDQEDGMEDDGIVRSSSEELLTVDAMHWQQRLLLIRPLLLPYMLPLFLVFWAEYTINQGVAPVLLFPADGKPFQALRDYYVFYQFLYQTGVFISRSSLSVFPVRRVWLLGALQVVNLLVLISQAMFGYIDSVWWISVIILWEGLLGGSTYVNAFANIAADTDPQYREYSMGVAAVADTLGITMAGLSSVFLSPALCQWQVGRGVQLCKQV